MMRTTQLLLAGLIAGAGTGARADGLDDGSPPCNALDNCMSTGERFEPHVFVTFGAGVRHFLVPSSIAYRTMSPIAPTQLTTARTYDARVGVGLPFGFYVAPELVGVDAEPTVGSQPLLVALVALGVEHRLGSISLAAELAGGITAYSPIDRFASDHVEPAAEVRGRAELWIAPWCTLEVVAGTSVLQPQAWIGAVEIGIHTTSPGR
jgi:hypothetical protein